MSSTSEALAGTATPTSGALTRAAARLRKREVAARRASVAFTAETTTGRAKPGPKTTRKLPSVQDLERIAVMKSQGLQNHQIARGLQVSRDAVTKALRDPGVIGQIQVFRERLRGTNLAAADAIAGRAWSEAEAALAENDRKGFDAVVRGLHAMEKIGASASGEDRKMEVTHQGMVPTEPIKIQLQQLIALVKDDDPRKD